MGPRSFISPFNPAAREAKMDQAGAPVRLRDSVCSIVRCVALMKRVFSNPLAALTAGLCLRLFFVLKFPANSGDTVLYEQIATNWLKHHVYAMTVGGQITPVDLRMPGYPAFLVIIYLLTGRTGADARTGVLLAQIGVGTLFRPETPILLFAAAMVFGGLFFLRSFRRWLSTGLAMALGGFLVLSPWALRNWMTLGEPQFLAPKNSNLPGELVPNGFMAWEKTWLYRVRDCYLMPWKLNEEAISVEDIPTRAFDTPEEKQHVAMILEQYNNDLTLTPDEDVAFAQLA